jgi:hypothetical protein
MNALSLLLLDNFTAYYYTKIMHAMRQIFQVLLGGVILFIMFFSSCEKVVYPPPVIPDTLSYSLDIQPIWDVKCIDCHNDPSVRDPDLRPDFSYDALISGEYVDTVDAANSKLMKKLYGSHNSRATEAEKQLVLKWINEGAKDN